MKQILIAGAGSYIGSHFAAWAAERGGHAVDTLDVADANWIGHDMTGYDAVVMVAGIAHRRETEKNAPLYYRVNRDLCYAVAKAAKAAGVKQFVFLSSMSVYGRSTGAIDQNTVPNPTTHYGRSKLAAEALIGMLQDATFGAAILRPPMVYGPGCRGNYGALKRLALRLPLFPKCGNARSMLYIDHLCEALRLIVEAGAPGLFFPQDREPVNPPEMMALIAAAHGRTLKLVPGLSGLMAALSRLGGPFSKAFGSLTYERALPGAPGDYQLYALSECVARAEGRQA